MSAGRQSDLRNAFRFPLHLPVTLKTQEEEYHAKTVDISAGGMLFLTQSAIPVGSAVEFTIELPEDVLASDRPVLVRCQGRVVRCSDDVSGRSVAVAIDEYHFERV